MARRYSSKGKTAAGTTLTIFELVGVTTTRAWIYDIIVGSDATPADIATEFQVIRGTVSGTGTGTVTPRATDPANPAALMGAKQGTFTGQTKTASSDMLDFGLNQRATFRWVAVPDGELVVPATADNWIGLESVASGGTPSVTCTMMWLE